MNEGRSILGDAVSQFDPLYDTAPSLLAYPQYIPSHIDGIGALFLEMETVIRGGPTEDVLRIKKRAYDVAFARNENVGAVLLSHFDADQFELSPQPRPTSLLAFGFDGVVRHQTDPTPPTRGYNQLYLSNDGSWAMVTQQGADVGSIATDEVVFIDIESGERSALAGISGGFRYHSMDGRYMVLYQAGWERVYLFNLENPAKPRLLWLREGFGMNWASINHDGSLVAVMGTSLVTLLDRAGNVVAQVPRREENGFAMMFSGDFLILGMQGLSHGGFADITPISRIDLYDVTPLR